MPKTAKRSSAKVAAEYPVWATGVKLRVDDFFLGSDDREAWVYRPLERVVLPANRSSKDRTVAPAPITAIFEELAADAQRRGARRRVNRQAHLLLVRCRDGRMRLVVGVKLFRKPPTGGFVESANEVADQLQRGGESLAVYDEDYERVAATFDRSGILDRITSEDRRSIESYWNPSDDPQVTCIPHRDHLHFIGSVEAVAVMDRLDGMPCLMWGDALDAHRAMTVAAVDGFDLDLSDERREIEEWASGLVRAGAEVISIRGEIRKPEVTESMSRRKKAEMMSEILRAYEDGEIGMPERDRRTGELETTARVSPDDFPAEFSNLSVVVVFPGIVPDPSMIAVGGISIAPMPFRQPMTWGETLICSRTRANPNLHDIPAIAVSMSGIGVDDERTS